MKVSVIVPVYNAEEYLPRCIASLRAQSLREMEVLLVDDGSTDGSAEILRDTEREDARFHVIRQENAGVAAARHTGIQCAQGEYVGFVDADDYVEPEMFQRMYCAASAEQADLAVCSYYEVREQERVLRSAGAGHHVIEGAFEAYVQCVAEIPAQWNKLYRRELALLAKEPLPLKIGEDMAFCTALAPYVRRAVILPQALYNYVIRDDSVMHLPRRMDGELNAVDRFLRNITQESAYDTPGNAWKYLLAIQAVICVMSTNYSYRQGVDFFRDQLAKLRTWSLFRDFCRDVAAGRCLKHIRRPGLFSALSAASMRLVFLLCQMRLDGLSAVLLTLLRRILELVRAARKRSQKAGDRV